MNITNVEITKLKPYERNSKKHPQEQINNVAESIKQYGFVQPIVIDKGNVVVIGHCRLLAAKKLKMKEVPCVCVDDLTPEQVAALRLVDNKSNESDWDMDLLSEELGNLDLSAFDFDFDFTIDDENAETEQTDYETKMKEFQERMESGELSDDDEEYQKFLEKFEAKKTTDDCYTPPIVYEAVADYVAEHYGVDKNNFVRPFVPGGDYQAEKYKPTDIVVDNPPFSILSEILNFYNESGIKFFLFAPHLTLFSSFHSSCSYITCGVGITYENSANVSTSFVTNMEDCAFRSAPKLYAAVKKANDENLKSMRKELPRYSYPLNVITPTKLTAYSKYGIDFEVAKDECYFIRRLDSQKESGKALYGAGYLISDKKKAEREKAEREKAEREKAEREKVEVWELSEREKEIIRGLK